MSEGEAKPGWNALADRLDIAEELMAAAPAAPDETRAPADGAARDLGPPHRAPPSAVSRGADRAADALTPGSSLRVAQLADYLGRD